MNEYIYFRKTIGKMHKTNLVSMEGFDEGAAVGGENKFLGFCNKKRDSQGKNVFWSKGVDGGAKNWYTQKGRANGA